MSTPRFTCARCGATFDGKPEAAISAGWWLVGDGTHGYCVACEKKGEDTVSERLDAAVTASSPSERVAYVGGRPEIFKVQPDVQAILRLREALGDAIREVGVDVVEGWLAETIRSMRQG